MDTQAAFYGGEYFRSELEARWAVFFDALRLRWRYDRGGFNAARGRWVTPAFWMPDLNRWVIVREWPKGVRQMAAPHERALWMADGATGLSVQQLRRLVVLYGPPVVPAAPGGGDTQPDAGAIMADVFGYDGANASGERHAWTECPKCHRIGLARDGEAQWLCRCFPIDSRIMTGTAERLKKAAERAGTADIAVRRMSQGLLTSEFRRHCMPN